MSTPDIRHSYASPRPTRRQALGLMVGLTSAVGHCLPVRAQTKNPRIGIGVTVDSTNVEKTIGIGLVQGSSAYFKAINREGGIHGAKVELVMADDQFNPEIAKTNVLAFAADPSVLAILHPLGTRQTAAAIEAVPGMAVVGPYTGTVSLRKKADSNAFWLRVNYDQELDKLVTMASTVGLSRIGFVYSDDVFGQSLLVGVKKALAKVGLEPAVTASTPNTISLDVEPAARAIAKASPQVIILGLAGTAPVFMRALRAAGSHVGAYGLSIAASSLRAGGLAFTMVAPSPFSARHELVRRYQADMIASGVNEFSQPSLEGYINAAVLAEGLRRAGQAPSRAALLASLERIESYDLGGLKIHFGRGNREGNQYLNVGTVDARGRLLS